MLILVEGFVMSLVCDHTSVGVIIENSDGLVLLLDRTEPLAGMAPPAGHIDELGRPDHAAIVRTREESGLRVSLAPPSVKRRRLNLKCHRPNGAYHKWWVYKAVDFTGEFLPNWNTTYGGGWYTQTELQVLADHTRQGKHTSHSPGLEQVWIHFFVELGYIH